MTEKEANERYSALDRRLRELTLLALVGLSLREYTKRFGALCSDWRESIPPYIDYGALHRGLWVSYRRYFIALRGYYLDEPDKQTKARLSKMLEDFGKREPFAEKERKIDLRSELSNEISHHEQYETLRKELGLDRNGMVSLFKDWANLPKRGGKLIEDEEECEDQGDLFVISTHQGCSNRCLPDQGKLVSKSLPAVYGLWTGKKKDGRNIYSLREMLARVDQWGYHNFILTGFNCRHHLHKYEGEMPHRYRFEEAREAYREEQKASEIERKARKLSNLSLTFAKIDDGKSEAYFRKWEGLKAKYLDYCSKSGIEPKEWLLR